MRVMVARWSLCVCVKPFGIFYYGEEIIEKVNEYKYLGVIFNTDSKHLHKTYSHLSTQANTAIFAVRKQSLPIVGPLSPLIAFKVFDSQILSILEYGSEIWYTGHDISEMEKINISYIRSTIGVHSTTPSAAIYGDTGRLPLLVQQQNSNNEVLDPAPLIAHN